MKIKKIVICGLFCAVMCLLAPLNIQIGMIPITLATFAIYVIGAATPPSYALASVICYITLGAVGLPVFSGFEGGLQKLFGITGGYIIGYVPCVLIISFLISKVKSKLIFPLSMALGTVVMYVLATVRYALEAKCSVFAATVVCVLPFLVGDAIKITLASITAPKIKALLEQNR